MTPTELIAHFGSIRSAADAVGVSYQVVWTWRYRGAIPKREQRLIEIVTDGSLKADVAHQTSQKHEAA